MSQFFTSVAKVLEFQLQHHYFQRNPRADLLQNGLVGPPCSPRDSQESSPTPEFKASILLHSAFFIVQLSHPYMTTGKTVALTRQTFVGKVMSLLYYLGLFRILFYLTCKFRRFSCVQLFVTQWTVARQAPLSVGFSRQEYWSGLTLPSPGDLPHPEMEPESPALQADP